MITLQQLSQLEKRKHKESFARYTRNEELSFKDQQYYKKSMEEGKICCKCLREEYSCYCNIEQ